jgi:hypothetical protein
MVDRYVVDGDPYVIDIWCKYGVGMFQPEYIVVCIPDNLSL